ncbi:MAG TPA: hypothetical protein VK324_02440 [Tepidisphaeraceae bacterium]|nr:hypothetical protein [Tepidisphaeraceae bacterium]
MKPDPIVEEVHRTREAIAAAFGNDLRAIYEDARRRTQQAARDGRVVLPPPPPRAVAEDRKAG